MFEGWGNFYFLLGSASASLIGLMFVVTTLTRGRDRSKVERGQRLFMTPTVFNLPAVLTLSAVALTPKLTPGVHEAVMALGGAYGLGYALVIGWQAAQLWRETKSTTYLSDVWCYGIIPPLIYLALESAILATDMIRDLACNGVALCLLALLLIAVRNAWDLVTWMAPLANAPPTDQSVT